MLIQFVIGMNRNKQGCYLECLTRVVAAANGVALAVANLDLEVMVLVRIFWWVKAVKVGAL